MLKIIKPMMAAKAKQEYIEEKLKDDNWVAEEKFDGSRYICHFKEDRLYFTSRRISVKTGLPVEKGLNLPHINKAVPELIGIVLDGEVTGPTNFGSCISIMGSNPNRALEIQKKNGFANYHTFSILYYKGMNVEKLPLRVRKGYLKEALEIWNNMYVKMVKQYYGKDKESLFNKIVNSGGEGIILKNLDSPYIEDGRKKECWIKVKKHSTWSCVIMGYTDPPHTSIDVNGVEGVNKFYAKNWISAVRLGVYKDGELIEIGKTSGMNEEVRQQLSEDKDKYIGKAIDVEGQEVTKDGSIRHPRWIRFRPDMNAEDCTWKKLKKSC